jgi:hypothetical protein
MSLALLFFVSVFCISDTTFEKRKNAASHQNVLGVLVALSSIENCVVMMAK